MTVAAPSCLASATRTIGAKIEIIIIIIIACFIRIFHSVAAVRLTTVRSARVRDYIAVGISIVAFFYGRIRVTISTSHEGTITVAAR